MVWLTQTWVVLELVALIYLTTLAQQNRGFLVAQTDLSAVQLRPVALKVMFWALETATRRAKAKRMVVAFILRFYLLLIKKLYSN